MTNTPPHPADPAFSQTFMGASPHAHRSHAPALSTHESLTLDPLTGPPIPPIEIPADAPKSLGRSSTCDLILPDESISRRHASIACKDKLWFLTDLASTHGTYLNSNRLPPQQPAPLKSGDVISLGPWTLRVRFGAASHASKSVLDDELAPSASRQRVERIQERELAAITQQRLNLLMECAAAVAGVEDERALAATVLQAAVQGSGFSRAALLKDLSQGAPNAAADIEVVLDFDPAAACAAPQAPPTPSLFSKSLIDAARKGEMVKLVVDDAGPGGPSASIVMLKIQTALCAPIKVGDQVAGFLYLDSRIGERSSQRPAQGPIPHDAATFVQAVAKMCSLAMGNLSRVALERRQAELLRDLSAAREAQQMIMPAENADLGPIRYAMRTKPGRMVAGDLFDVVPIDQHRVAVFLGDVAGKGISAAILMATAQTFLNATLLQYQDPVQALIATNKHVCAHAASNKFISLWLGVFDSRTNSLAYVDAGHGYWLLLNPDGSTSTVGSSSGIPLGIDDAFDYPGASITLQAGARLVVFSDGVVEQPNPDGVMFGVDRAAACLAGSPSVHSDADTIFNAVLDFAKTDSLADDTTVASISFLPA